MVGAAYEAVMAPARAFARGWAVSAPPRKRARRNQQHQSPYVGLVPFCQDDWPFFFGRGADREVIAANLQSARLTVLYGPSGVGKSSLVRAGVEHYLQELNVLEVKESGCPLSLVVVFPESSGGWRDDPSAALMEAIRNVIARDGAPTKGKDVAATARTLRDLITKWDNAAGVDLLIILDQFEEYFRYHADGGVGNVFAAELTKAVTDKKLRVNVLLTIREEELAKLDRFKDRIPKLFDNYLRVQHLSRASAAEAMREPLRVYRETHGLDETVCGIESELVEAILDDVRAGDKWINRRGTAGVEDQKQQADDRVETSFLQLVLSRLWEYEQDKGSDRLCLSSYVALGRANNIVRSHLDRSLSALTRRQQDVAERLFDRLVTPSGTKFAMSQSDLANKVGLPEARVSEVIKRLCSPELRVLREVGSTGSRNRVPQYELYHDLLAEAAWEWQSRHQRERRRLYWLLALGTTFAVLLALLGQLALYAIRSAERAKALAKFETKYNETEPKFKKTSEDLFRSQLLQTADLQWSVAFQERNLLRPSDPARPLGDDAILQLTPQQWSQLATSADYAPQFQKAVRLQARGSRQIVGDQVVDAWKSLEESATIVAQLPKSAPLTIAAAKSLSTTLSTLSTNLIKVRPRFGAAALRTLLSLRNQAVDNDDSSASRRETGTTDLKLGDVDASLLDFNAARYDYERAMATFARMQAALPSDSAAERNIQVAYDGLGHVASKVGDTSRALDYFRRSLVVDEARWRDDMSAADAARDFAVSYYNLGDIMEDRGQLPEARKYCSDAVRLRRKPGNTADVPTVGGLGEALQQLARVEMSAGSLSAARASFEEGVAICEESLKGHQDDRDAKWHLANALEEWGTAATRLGEVATSERVWKRALKLRSRLAEGGEWRAKLALAAADERLTEMSLLWGEPALAGGFSESCLRARKEVAQELQDNAREMGLSWAMLWRGNALWRTGYASEAWKEYEGYLAQRRTLNEELKNPFLGQYLAYAYVQLGTIAIAEGNAAKAASFFERAGMERKALSEKNVDSFYFKRALAVESGNLGDVALECDKVHLAEKQYAEAASALKRLAAECPEEVGLRAQVAFYAGRRGRCRIRSGDFVGGAKVFQEEVDTLTSLGKQGKIALRGLAWGDAPSCNEDRLEKARSQLAACRNRYAAKAIVDSSIALQQPSGEREELLALGAEMWAREGQYERAADIVRLLRKLNSSAHENEFRVACCYSRCIRAVTRGRTAEQLSAKERAATELYASEAITALRKVLLRSPSFMARVLREPDLDIIRPQPAYRDLLKTWQVLRGLHVFV